MLAPGIDFIDIDARHWRQWYELLVPPPLRGDASFALLFVDETRPARLIAGVVHRREARVAPRLQPIGPAHAGDSAGAPRGALKPDDLGDLTPPALERVARALDVDAVIALDVRVTAAIYDQIAPVLTADIDLVAQALTALRVCKRRRDQGIWTHPPMLELLPQVSYERLQRSFDLLCPDRTSLVFYVLEDDTSDVHASLIAVKQSGDLDLVTTHLGLEDALAGPDLASDWRHRYRDLLALVTERHAPASLAVFLERRTFLRIATGPSDQFARELNARNVVIDPAPTWLLGLLGGATMAAFASRGAKALARMLPTTARRVAADLASTAQTVIRDSGAHPFDLLGFDPIALWHDLRTLYRHG